MVPDSRCFRRPGQIRLGLMPDSGETFGAREYGVMSNCRARFRCPGCVGRWCPAVILPPPDGPRSMRGALVRRPSELLDDDLCNAAGVCRLFRLIVPAPIETRLLRPVQLSRQEVHWRCWARRSRLALPDRIVTVLGNRDCIVAIGRLIELIAGSVFARQPSSPLTFFADHQVVLTECVHASSPCWRSPRPVDRGGGRL